METRCVRCNNFFKQFSHPAAHFFTICFECRKKNEETINDQQRYQYEFIKQTNGE